MKYKYQVGDIVRISEAARELRPWTVWQTMDGDMVIVKQNDPPFAADEKPEVSYDIERADGNCFVGVCDYEAYQYEREVFYESDLELVEGRRF